MSKKILIIKLGALGDLIMALPHFAYIRKQNPNHHISLLTRPIYVDFMQHCPYFDEVVSDGNPSSYNLPGLLSVRRKIKNGQFSMIYNLQGTSKSKRYLFLADKNLAKPPSVPNDFFTDKDWLKQGNIGDFGLQKPYVVIVAGCAPHRVVKRWSAENYGKLCVAIAEQGFQPVLCGGESEVAIAEEILHHCPTAKDLTNHTNILEAASVIGSAHAVVGNDTGLVHIAVSMARPTFVLLSAASQHIFADNKPAHVKDLRSDDLADLSVAEVISVFKTL